MIGRVAAPAAAKAVASAPVKAIWGAQRGVVYDIGVGGGLNTAVLSEATKYGVRKEVVEWAKAHPTIVPFINGDKDMIHSIAETGWTRWLVGDGNGNLISNITNYDRIVLNVVLTGSLSNSNIFGYNYNNSGTQRRKSFGFNGSGLPTFGTGDGNGGYVQQSGGWNLGTPYKVEGVFSGNNAKLYQNDVLKYEGNASKSNPIPCGIFCVNQNGTTRYCIKGKGKDAMVYNNGELIGHFLPCLHNSNMELLDVVTGTFATRVGTFTQSLEQNPQE